MAESVNEEDMVAAQAAWDDVFGHLPGNPPWVARLAQHFANYRADCAAGSAPNVTAAIQVKVAADEAAAIKEGIRVTGRRV